MKYNFKAKKDYVLLTLKKPSCLAILFFKDIKNDNIPFRYHCRWWRKEGITKRWGETIQYKFTKHSFLYSTQPFHKKNARYFSEDDLVATFDELLNEKEKEFKISEIILE